MSYHDLYITTSVIPRTRIADLPYGYMVTCTRTGGWELWKDRFLVASEYSKGEDKLRLEWGGSVLTQE